MCGNSCIIEWIPGLKLVIPVQSSDTFLREFQFLEHFQNFNLN